MKQQISLLLIIVFLPLGIGTLTFSVVIKKTGWLNFYEKVGKLQKLIRTLVTVSIIGTAIGVILLSTK